MIDWVKFKQELKHAFATGPANVSLSEEDLAFLEKIATIIVKRGLSTPAIMFLDMYKPLSFLGSQVLAFFEPFMKMVIPKKVQYDRIMNLMEKRSVIDAFIKIIDDLTSTSKRNGERIEA